MPDDGNNPFSAADRMTQTKPTRTRAADEEPTTRQPMRKYATPSEEPTGTAAAGHGYGKKSVERLRLPTFAALAERHGRNAEWAERARFATRQR